MRHQRLRLLPVDRLVAGLLVVASVLPYLAFPLGNSTNVPYSSVLALWLIVRGLRHWPLLKLAFLVAAMPVAANFLRMAVSAEPWSTPGMINWIFASAPIAGMAAAVIVLRSAILPWLSYSLLASSVVGLVQKYAFLDQGVVPWLWAYDQPGYASVKELATSIALYVRRPFGLFPEPSFMAGTLSMLAFALLLALHYSRKNPGPVEWLAFGSCIWVVAISGSGAAVVSIVLLTAALVLPLLNRHALAAVVLIPIALVTAVSSSAAVLSQRQSSVNYSWTDRMSSLGGSAQLLLSDPAVFLLGIGRGNSSLYFLTGRIPLDDFPHFTVIPDIYSVLGRIVLENGVVLGGTFLIATGWWIMRSGGRRQPVLGLSALIVWIVAGGLAISYDTAFWIFGFPGFALGLWLVESNHAVHWQLPDNGTRQYDKTDEGHANFARSQ